MEEEEEEERVVLVVLICLAAAVLEWAMPNPTPEEIRAIENDPFVRQFMEQAMQDPEVLRPMMQVMEQNPQIQQLMNANPELRQAMQDPEKHIEGAESVQGSEFNARAKMAATDRTLANIESHPEGFNALRRMYEKRRCRCKTRYKIVK